MTEEQQVPDQDATAEEDPRKQLWVRASVAGGLIGLLLGGLALFDHLSRPPAPAEIVLPTKPIAPAQVAPETGRDAPPEVVRAGEAVESVPPEAAPATSEGSAPPILPEGERAERVGRIGEGTRPLARPPVSAGGGAGAQVCRCACRIRSRCCGAGASRCRGPGESSGWGGSCSVSPGTRSCGHGGAACTGTGCCGGWQGRGCAALCAALRDVLQRRHGRGFAGAAGSGRHSFPA